MTVRVGHGRYLAEHISGSNVELEGADDLYWVGETEIMLDEIEEFQQEFATERAPTEL